MLLINFLVLDNEARAKHQGDSIRLRHCHDEAARASPDMAEARELPGRNSSDPAAVGERRPGGRRRARSPCLLLRPSTLQTIHLQRWMVRLIRHIRGN